MAATSQLTAIRPAVIGLAQGLALYLLYHASKINTWPATDGTIFAPLLSAAIFVPTILVTGLGNLRIVTLSAWLIVAIALCAGLAFHDIYRDPSDDIYRHPYTSGHVSGDRIMPMPATWLALAATLFILDALIVAGDADRRWIASYAQKFDVAWKHGVQLALATVFVGIFWILLWPGAELFQLLRIELLYGLIQRAWFWIPTTTLVLACAIHMTDVNVSMVRGARTLALTLFAWLLLVMTLMVGGFLLALPFTGLEPLWSTQHAAAIVLTAIATLVILINAAYQDGDPHRPIGHLLRVTTIGAIAAVAALDPLAVYALVLRVLQYGWTPDRVLVAACVVVATCYAIGYALAAARSGASLRGVGATNFATALVIVAVLIALFSPIADPARISVADQIRRLHSGKVAPARFDFAFLRFRAGRYGLAALDKLASSSDGPEAARVAELAQQAKRWDDAWEARFKAPVMTPEIRAANITVLYPGGQSLPGSFLRQDWSTKPGFSIPNCLEREGARCDAIMVDLDGDDTPEIILLGRPGIDAAFKKNAGDEWTLLGVVQNAECPGVQDGLKAGQVNAVEPALKDLAVNGQRLRVTISACGTNR